MVGIDVLVIVPAHRTNTPPCAHARTRARGRRSAAAGESAGKRLPARSVAHPPRSHGGPERARDQRRHCSRSPRQAGAALSCLLRTGYRHGAAPSHKTRLRRGSGGVGCGLRQRRGEEALHRVEWLGVLVCSAQDEGALESCKEYGGVVLCVDRWTPNLTKAACIESRHRSRRARASCRSRSSPLASTTVAPRGHPIVKLLSTSTWRQGAKIASIASASVAASLSLTRCRLAPRRRPV